ncbi:IPT/TIG domain-containing protein [candidate division KSB1 bacterium]|nr:IPT/TIG domain-containing protein [candidate division KSB1 bacterium]
MMKTMNNALKILLSLGLALLVFSGCENEYPDSVFDPNADGVTQPVITGMTIEPNYNGDIMAGLSVVTLSGQNFSATAEDNFIFFNDSRARVLSASANQIAVLAPENAIGDSVRLRTTVFGSEFFSDLQYVKVVPTVQSIGSFLSTDVGIKAEVDAAENVYVAMRAKMIKVVDPLGGTLEFTEKPLINGNDMKMGPGNLLYMSFVAGRVRILARFKPDGSEDTRINLRKSPMGFDFDQAGNAWVAADDYLLRVKTDGTSADVLQLPALLGPVRIYNGHVYVGSYDATTSDQKIWKCEIQGEALGAAQEVLSLTAADWLEGEEIRSFTFSSDGDMILATTHHNGVYIYRESDGSHQPLYTNLVGSAPGTTVSFESVTWGNDVFLYAIQKFGIEPAETFKLLKINMLKTGAPYFGRN